MKHAWTEYRPLVVAVLSTALLTWIYAAVPGDLTSAGAVALWVGQSLAAFLVPALWGWALLKGQTRGAAVIGATLCLTLILLILPLEVAWPLAGYILAGVAAGYVLAFRWRLDVALGLITLALLPALIWASAQPVMMSELKAQHAEYRVVFLEAMEMELPENISDEQRAQALEETGQQYDEVAQWVIRVLPATLALGVLGQAGLILGLVLLIGRKAGLQGLGRRLPRFSHWRLPFYLVWLLILSVGLMITTVEVLFTIGLNLALVIATLLSVQGLAVQVVVTNRVMSPIGRVVFWGVMGIFLILVLAASSVLLGLLDQWFDLRRLYANDSDDSGR